MVDVKHIQHCRICNNSDLVSLFNLGDHALSGRFPGPGEAEPRVAPLELVKCRGAPEKTCGLVQLAHEVPSDELYNHRYGYRSGLNQTMTRHLGDLVAELEQRVELQPGDVVVDIGSNDATLLRSYGSPRIRKIGIDPTGTQFKHFYPGDVQLVPDFFTAEAFKGVAQGEKAKAITSIAMFYDLPKPLNFVRDVRDSLRKDGVWVFEQSYLPSMLETTSFDTICHEHLEYYGLKQIEWMLNQADMKLVDVSLNACNGGSFRLTAAHADAPYAPNQQAIETLRASESRLALDTLKPFEEFKARSEQARTEINAFLRAEKAQGKSIYVYGASTKGNTLLQYFGLDNTVLTAAAERNTEKFGRRTPATNIPILSEAEVRAANPDYMLVLPWHFKQEFLAREKAYLDNGGKFIFPLPKFDVIGRDYLEHI